MKDKDMKNIIKRKEMSYLKIEYKQKERMSLIDKLKNNTIGIMKSLSPWSSEPILHDFTPLSAYSGAQKSRF